uniref:Uncharacterized protein n=1 Tax=Rhizophora mucronata TaxID=61149 RepID=A0A2P2ND12_RHIMU
MKVKKKDKHDQVVAMSCC